jgi:hypothetical protein
LTDFLTEEQIKKRAIISEDVDMKGLVRRHRVADQTMFDMMFLLELIRQPHHEAIHLFLDALSISGTSCKSCNLDSEVHTAAHTVGNALGERRMAFSKAYRSLVGDVGEDMSSLLLKYSGDVYNYPEKKKSLESISKYFKPALDSLSSYYGTEGRVDPRRVLRRQLGGK